MTTNKIKNAAIILLGIGEKSAGDILKAMTPKEVRAIIEAINGLDNITEEDVITALNDFFTESNHSSGIDITSKEAIKNSLLAAVRSKGIGLGTLIQGVNGDKERWLELVKGQPMKTVVDLIQDEHPQIITALVVLIFNNIGSDQGTELIKAMPRALQKQVFRRMAYIGHISKAAIDAFAAFFFQELDERENGNLITVDGLETVANIISYLDSDTEKVIMEELTGDNKELGEKILDKMFPFSRLADLDKRSIQILLSEANSEDLVIALKGVDEHIKEYFMQNMSTKSAEILRDEMESQGPVKIARVLDAQKNIIRLAKKLDQEEKIVLSNKNNPDVVT
ncbi:MAG: flagellar motor switch protein FliG [Gammaproteobacteria bacterium]